MLGPGRSPTKRGVRQLAPCCTAMEQGRPEDLFELLQELGKGSYGAVYKVRALPPPPALGNPVGRQWAPQSASGVLFFPTGRDE